MLRKLMKHTRHLENIHIPLWLFKDTCWMLHWKLTGVMLVLPTVSVAAIIAWRTRGSRDLFLPNLAVTFWISANSLWMLGEFFSFSYMETALPLFVAGILVISYFFYLLLSGKIRDTRL